MFLSIFLISNMRRKFPSIYKNKSNLHEEKKIQNRKNPKFFGPWKDDKICQEKVIGSEEPRWAYSLKFLGFSKRLDYAAGTRFDRATCAVVRDEFRHWASCTSGAQNIVFPRPPPTFALLSLLLVLCCSLFRIFSL
jgi:hypothetical protein